MTVPGAFAAAVIARGGIVEGGSSRFDALLAPVLFGLLVDTTGSYTLAWSLVGLGFAATVLVILGWRRSAAHASLPASRTA